jgi:hypothetical protein
MAEWQSIETAPEGIEVETKIDDGDGVRNVQPLTKRTRIPGKTRPLWFMSHPDMYVYYTPTHWRPKTGHI